MGLPMVYLVLLEEDSSPWMEGQVQIPSHREEVVLASKSKGEHLF